MTKAVSQKPKNKPLSVQVRKAMKKYFATLGDTDPANVYEMVIRQNRIVKTVSGSFTVGRGT